ncbi:MAG: hypothetical protein V4436_01525 [Patescibacteria group bacterium]
MSHKTARINSFDDAQTALRTVRDTTTSFSYSEQATRSGRGTVHANLDIKGKLRECLDTPDMPLVTPIALAMDVTRSRGNDAKVVYAQLLPFLGALHLSGAVTNPQLLFAAFGDAKTDRAPLQIGQFESDERMDADLERMWLEEGGGGTGEESSELVAYFLARHTKIDSVDKRGKKGFCFITSDEAPYPVVSAAEVERIIGDHLDADIPTPQIFAELQERFNTFLLYPGKPLAERQDDIDAEIRQRLLKAGGRFENVSIRASLIWETRDDLDLHVVTPKGEHIFFSTKRASCGGELDVDRNVGGETRTPIENIRWAKGTALPGKYHVYVQNFRYHEVNHTEVPFKVELDIDGKIQSFTGKTKAGINGPASDVTAFTFDYSPEEAVVANTESRDAYSDEVILAKWRASIPDSNIIRLSDVKWTTEAAIGIMALQNGVKDIDGVLEDMRERAVPAAGIEDVGNALRVLARQGVFHQVDDAAFA